METKKSPPSLHLAPPRRLLKARPRGGLLPIPKLLEHLLHPIHLIGSEPRVTTLTSISHHADSGTEKYHSPSITTIVHEIPHRILSGTARTTVLPRRTPTCRRTLLRRICNEIPRIAQRARPILEGMQQAEPMPDLVNGRQTLVVPVHAATRHRARQDVAPIGRIVRRRELHRRAGRAGEVGDVGGEGAVAKELLAGVRDGAGAARAAVGRAQVRLEVDVQVGVAALAEGGLHARVVGVGRPEVIRRPGGALQHEGDGG